MRRRRHGSADVVRWPGIVLRRCVWRLSVSGVGSVSGLYTRGHRLTADASTWDPCN